MATNQYGQQTTDGGHVIKESERIAEQLKSLDRAMYQDEPYGDIKLPLKDLVAFIMDYAHTEWSKSVKHGIQLGRNDAVSMLKPMLKEGVSVAKIEAVITALEETA